MVQPAITDSVGKGGVNRIRDVKIVQTLLNMNVIIPYSMLSVDGKVGPKTISAIEDFQRKIAGLRRPDGRVDPGGITFRVLTSSLSNFNNNSISDKQFNELTFRKQIGAIVTYQKLRNSKTRVYTSNGGKCPNCLDPSTVGKNLLGLTYPGGNNPLTYNKDYTYQYVPKRLSEYPAIGHDRRYDNLKTAGLKGLLTDMRAIGADWRFVGEELSIAFLSNDPITKMQASILGAGLGLAALPKTIHQLAQPNGQGFINIIIWYNVSNVGITNKPSTHTH